MKSQAFGIALVTALSAVLFIGCGADQGAGSSNSGRAMTDATKFFVYVGTYTGQKSKGIYLLRLDTRTGQIGNEGLAGETTNPTFLAIDSAHMRLFSVGETGNFAGQKTGSVSSFSIDRATGKLTAINQQPSGGAGPCYVTLDRDGKNALVANYGAGSFSVLPIGPDGKLSPPSCVIQHQGKGPNPKRQEGPHGHSINFDPAYRFAIAADLGLDTLSVYHFDPAKGMLTENDPPAAKLAPGSGPRHFTFHPDGKHAYCINELASTVTAFEYDAGRGILKGIQTLTTLPADFKGQNTTAEVRVHPSGKFLYGSNRGHNSIAIFSVDQKTGRLTAAGHQSTQGKTPRNFNIDPTGTFLLAANQDSDSVVPFRIDPSSGQLSPHASPISLPIPVCIRFLAIE